MKRLACFLLILSAIIWVQCGGDDNGVNPPPETTARIVASHPGSSPSLNDPDDAVWNTVTPTGIALSYQNALKPGAAKPAAAADSVRLQAVVRNDSLFLRAVWSDATHNVWLDHYEVFSTSPVNFTRDCCGSQAAGQEDELIAMFAGLPGGAWDVWNWRALTTGPGYLAEGMTFTGGELVSDSSGLQSGPALNHSPLGGTSQPTYMHKDSSAFHGYLLYLADAVPFRALSTGWTEGQAIPGKLIDTSIYSRQATTRGPRWAIRAADDYDSTGNQYTVVMCRALNTGFDDDLNLLLLDSVKMKVVVLNNQVDLTMGTNNRGISKELWLIF